MIWFPVLRSICVTVWGYIYIVLLRPALPAVFTWKLSSLHQTEFFDDLVHRLN